jgi:citrate synthase
MVAAISIKFEDRLEFLNELQRQMLEQQQKEAKTINDNTTAIVYDQLDTPREPYPRTGGPKAFARGLWSICKRLVQD